MRVVDAAVADDVELGRLAGPEAAEQKRPPDEGKHQQGGYPGIDEDSTLQSRGPAAAESGPATCRGPPVACAELRQHLLDGVRKVSAVRPASLGSRRCRYCVS